MAPEPCKVCGSPVRMRRVRLPDTLADDVPDVVEERVCTNRACETNERPATHGTPDP